MKVTSKDDLTAWLDGLSERFTLIATQAVEEQVLYRPVAGSSEIAFDFSRTVLTGKVYF